MHEPFPESDGAVHPSLSICARAKPETVLQVLKSVEFNRSSGFAQSRDSPFHYVGGCNPVLLTCDCERWRLIGTDLRVRSVGRHHDRWTRENVTPKECGSVGANGGSHSRACRAAPQRVIGGSDAKRLAFLKT